MAEAVIRRDVWGLEEEQSWHPILEAYALAVAAMQERDTEDPTSWAYQAAVHGVATGEPPDDFRNQCQHRTWFFLPWHRMYLCWFERIVRATVSSHPDVSDDVRESWALPYWNYDRGGSTAELPPSFREPAMADGRPNPLFVTERDDFINQGGALDPMMTSPSLALAELEFSLEGGPGLPGGFGGPVTGWQFFGPESPGEIEKTPHNDVHGAVGGSFGFMSGFDTAPLDPVFYLHHANVDRLWAVWRGQTDPAARADPTDSRWTGFEFQFHDEQGAEVSLRPEDVLTTEALGYVYDDVAPAVAPRRRGFAIPTEPPPDHPPELVGATDERVELTGDDATVAVPLEKPTGPLLRAGEEAEPSRVYLNLEGIEGERNPGVAYAVYVNLPDDEDADTDPERHYVGNVSFFGIELATDTSRDDHGGHGLRYAFDITPLVNELRKKNRWDPAQMKVTFSPLRVQAPPGAAPTARAAEPTPPVSIGRVSLYYQ
jgi:tyrosinase